MTSLFTTLVVVLFFAATSSALGINCRGSGLCPLATFENSEGVAQGLRDGIYSSTLDDSTTYNSGDHVICVSASLKVNIGGNLLGITGNIGSGGVCVFPQGLEQALTLGSIKSLADALLNHGCKTCGSVPVHFVDEGSNDPGAGILTFNYVGDPTCTGNCISAEGNSGSGGPNENGGGSTVTVTTSAALSAVETSSAEPVSTEPVSTELSSTEPTSTSLTSVPPTVQVTQTVVVTSTATTSTGTCGTDSSSTVTIVLTGTNTLFPGTTITSTIEGCAGATVTAASGSPAPTSSSAASATVATALSSSSPMTTSPLATSTTATSNGKCSNTNLTIVVLLSIAISAFLML